MSASRMSQTLRYVSALSVGYIVAQGRSRFPPTPKNCGVRYKTLVRSHNRRHRFETFVNTKVVQSHSRRHNGCDACDIKLYWTPQDSKARDKHTESLFHMHS
jgi:hypothetical protein